MLTEIDDGVHDTFVFVLLFFLKKLLEQTNDFFVRTAVAIGIICYIVCGEIEMNIKGEGTYYLK